MHYYTSLGTCAGLQGSMSTFIADPTPRCGTRPAVAAEDLDLLLGAVTERLRAAAVHAVHDSSGLSIVVLECTEALGLLQQMLVQARDPLPVQVLRESDSGGIVTCWASAQARSVSARTPSLRRAA